MHKSTNRMAANATLHCLTGCSIGEITGLVIGAAIGLNNGWSVVLSTVLAFMCGYTLSTLPIVKTGLGFTAALAVVLAADTLSILSMEVADNITMVIIPGAMNAGLVNTVFWFSMMISLSVGFIVAFPVNRYLLLRGRGHALTHEYHHQPHDANGIRKYIPDFSPVALACVIASFMLGGLVVAMADAIS